MIHNGFSRGRKKGEFLANEGGNDAAVKLYVRSGKNKEAGGGGKEKRWQVKRRGKKRRKVGYR